MERPLALNRCLDTQPLVVDATEGKTSCPQSVLFRLKWSRWKGRILRYHSKRKGVVKGDKHWVGEALVPYLWDVIDDLSIGWDLKWNESVVSVPDMVCKEKKDSLFEIQHFLVCASGSHTPDVECGNWLISGPLRLASPAPRLWAGSGA